MSDNLFLSCQFPCSQSDYCPGGFCDKMNCFEYVCSNCYGIYYRKDIENNLGDCPSCGELFHEFKSNPLSHDGTC